MKKHLTNLLVITTLLLIVSCKSDKNQSNITEVQNPEALQDGVKSRILSKNGSDLVEDLYAELVEKTPELKKLESELYINRDSKYETPNIFHNYNNKSIQFYKNATDVTTGINDSLSKKRILAFIKKSSEKYKTDSEEINQLVKQISNTQNTIEDNHTILKIVLTVPLIEKYQLENKPKKKVFLETIAKQKKLNEKLLIATPKY